MNKKIIVNIKKDAKITLETDGYKGESCILEIKKILAGFVEVDSFEYKSDFYDNDQELQQIEELKL